MKYTIKDFKQQFPESEICLEYVFKYRFGDKFPCPSCNKASWHKIQERKAWACAFCAYQIHPLAGTIFHKSDTDLTLWFFAIYKFSNSRNGVAAKELQRDLGVTYKTAWRMAKQIRTLKSSNPKDKLSGIVEVDEAYIGSVLDPKTRKHKDNLARAVAMVERRGGAKVFTQAKGEGHNTTPLLKEQIEPGSMVMTDSAPYNKAYKFPNHFHSSVNHTRGEYVRRGVHINSVEGFISQIKRSIDGTYHRISSQHLQSYLDEFAWRLSNGRSQTPLFLLLLERLCQSPYVKG